MLNTKEFFKQNTVYEDDILVVVNKPAGIVVNKAESQKDNITICDYSLEYLKDVLAKASSDSEFVNRGGIVHRLDKETSGLLIIAKDEKAFELMLALFKDRKIEKEYICICYADKVLIENKKLVIRVPLARNPKDRRKFSVVEDGKPSETYIEVRNIFTKDSQAFAFLSLFPKTGRTHQIRVHLTAINSPILGDSEYSGKKRYRNNQDLAGKMLLHAIRLKFQHPVTGATLEIKTEMPEIFTKFLEGVDLK